MQRLGGYPRFWLRSGDHWDGLTPVADADVAAFEEGWRQVHVRVEWLRSPRGRIDHLLPQTIQRYVHNERLSHWREREQA